MKEGDPVVLLVDLEVKPAGFKIPAGTIGTLQVIERDDDHLQHRFLARGPPAGQKQLEVRGMGKLGRGAETAQPVVEGLLAGQFLGHELLGLGDPVGEGWPAQR